MRIIDPGHLYELELLDAELGARHLLQFVKREGPGYPGNVGHHHGTNLQEVFRVCIDRLKYLDGQIPHAANLACVGWLRQCIDALELRAAQRHGRKWPIGGIYEIEKAPTCRQCGHIRCSGECRTKGDDSPGVARHE